MRLKIHTPYWTPIWCFAGAILFGALILRLDISHPGGPLSMIDALFTATSAVCVTGLAVVDTGTFFSPFGHDVILVLVQLGGLGIITFTTLIIRLIGKHISLTDRLAVRQSLLNDPSFSLPKFVARVVIGTFLIEAVGALSLWLMDPVGFHPYSAVFHSVSAFCNAGLSLYSDNLTRWAGHAGVNAVFMTLIVVGGLGFYVLNECVEQFKTAMLKLVTGRGRLPRLSWHSSIVLKTSLFLIVAGAAIIFFAEGDKGGPVGERVLTALFQSVSCRTAGFNTVDIGGMTNVSLTFMMALMLIGGSPGSCAGGIKTTTFRALCGFVAAQFRGREQVQIGRFALGQDALKTIVSLVTMTVALVALGTLVLTALEAKFTSTLMAREDFLANMFETVSAYGTVGLSTGITPALAQTEKMVVIALMFVGRLGPVWLLSALQSWQSERRYLLPTADLPLG